MKRATGQALAARAARSGSSVASRIGMPRFARSRASRIRKKPARVLQLEKAGSSKQARLTSKLTHEGPCLCARDDWPRHLTRGSARPRSRRRHGSVFEDRAQHAHRAWQGVVRRRAASGQLRENARRVESTPGRRIVLPCMVMVSGIAVARGSESVPHLAKFALS